MCSGRWRCWTMPLFVGLGLSGPCFPGEGVEQLGTCLRLGSRSAGTAGTDCSCSTGRLPPGWPWGLGALGRMRAVPIPAQPLLLLAPYQSLSLLEFKWIPE